MHNDFEITPEEKAQGKSSSRWVMLARSGNAAAPLLKIGTGNDWMEGWGGELWTDDFSDILTVIQWR